MRPALIALALLLVPSPASAQKKSTAEVHKSNLPPERRPTPLPDEVASSKEGKGLGEELGERVLSWHASLARRITAPLAWVALAAPLWLPLSILLVVRLVRRRRAREAERPPAKRERREARGEGARGERPRPGGPRGDRTAPVLIAINLHKDQEPLVARSGQGPAIYDTFLALGPDPDALRSFRELLRRELDAATWASVVNEGRATKLRALGPDWAAAVAIARVTGWLGRHPLIAGQALCVQAPSGLAEGEIEGLALTQADGLGTTLDGEQKQLLYQARRALSRIGANLAEPLSLVATAGQTRLLALLPSHLCEPGERAAAPYALALAVRGVIALDWAIALGLFPAKLATDLRDHLQEHDKLVGTPVPAEGSAVHALEALRGQGCGEPLGLLLASVAGAAFSSSSVAIQLSKRVGGVFAVEAHEALVRLGERLRAALADPSSADRKLLAENARWLLGEVLLSEEVKRAAALVKEVERWSARDPLWRGAGSDPRPPDLALATFHAHRVKVALDSAAGARERLLAILERLGQAGSGEREQRLGAERIGLAVAGLGMPLLHGGDTELLSLGRDAIKLLSREGS